MISVLTTIHGPSDCTKKLVDRLQRNNSRLIVVGDKKGPGCYSLPDTTFVSLEDQMAMSFHLVRLGT